MTAKEFFNEVRAAQEKIGALERRRERYRELAVSFCGMNETRIRAPKDRSRTENAAVALADLDDQLSKDLQALVEKIREAEVVLGKMPTPRYQDILTRRYLLLERWEVIRAAVGYRDEKSVFRAHGWALQEAQKILDRG